jgi:hypothetical protein
MKKEHGIYPFIDVTISGDKIMVKKEQIFLMWRY